MNPQAGLDAPRWQWQHGRSVAVEPAVDPTIIAGLRERGHDVKENVAGASYGRGQIIWRLPDGGYVAGSDPRADGYATGY
jgi:gamma-glutamyltranspeptidase/glutathione hydrolase